MDSNKTLNPGNRLLTTWVNMAYKIEDRYLPSIHFWDSGPWQVLYFPLFLLFGCFLVDLCLLFLFSCFSDSSLSSQESILTCLLFFWLILKLYHFCYGSITSYYSILLNCIIVDYFILFCLDYYLVLFLLLYFYFHFIFLLVLLSPLKFYLILCCICWFYLAFVLLYLLTSYIIMYPT